MNINFQRLNYILIPDTKAGRDRWRNSRAARVLGPVGELLYSITVEGQIASVLCFAAALAGLDVRETDAHMAFCALTGMLLASIVSARWVVLRDVTLTVHCPPRVTVGETLSLVLSVDNRGAAPIQALRIQGPFLSWDGTWISRTPSLARVEPGAVGSVQSTVRFIERGEHWIDPFRLAALAPFGFCLGPPVRSGGVHFMVVPKVARVVRIDMPIAQKHQPGGVALASRTGESMDLLGVRPYRPGDPVRDLHARSWARVGYPVVREYQQEYFSRVGVVLDTRLQGASDALLEAALSLAAGLLASLSRGEALIDLLVLGDTLHDLTLGRAQGFFEQGLDLLACARPATTVDHDALVRRLAPFLPRLSCVLFVSLSSSPDRRAFAASLRHAGAPVRSYVVHKGAAPVGTDMIPVSSESITRGDPLTL